MNKRKFIISTVIMVLLYVGTLHLSMGVTDVYAENQEVDFQYTVLHDGTVEITGWYSEEEITEIIIPSEIDGRKVTSIGNLAFSSRSDIDNVEIPNTITNIETNAFYNCSSLLTLELPESVEIIGDNAFFNVPNVSYNGNAEGYPWGAKVINGYVDGGLVYESSAKMEVLACPTNTTGIVTVPSSVTAIGEDAFRGCKSLENVELPESVKIIGKYAFGECTTLISIEVPAEIEKVETSAFSYVPNVIYNGQLSTGFWGARTYNGYIEGCLVYEDGSKKVLSACVATAKEVDIPDSVVTIGSHAFYDCSLLTEVEIPQSVKSIEYSAFEYCTNLKSVKMPDDLTSIEQYTFYGCYELMNIEIPDNVTYIGIAAFYLCESLTDISLPEKLTTMEQDAFGMCNSLVSIEFNNELTSIGDSAFVDCWCLKNVKIPESVTSIGKGAFEYCINLISVEIPESVTDMGEAVFDYSELTTIFCKKDSYARTYAVENDIPYLFIDSSLEDTTISSVTASGTSNIIKWNIVDRADGYEILRKAETKREIVESWSVISTVVGDSINLYEDSNNIEPGTTYSYIVRAYREVDCEKLYSFNSDEKSVIAILDKAIVTTCATSKGVNVVKWKAVDKADGYIVMRRSLKSAEWEEIAEIRDSSIVRYEDTNVSTDSRYYYTIKAYYNNLGQEECIYAEYASDNTGVIASVGTVILQNITTEAGSNKVTWEPIAGVQGYVIKRKTDGGKWINLAVLKGADRCEYVDSKAIYAGSEYTYTIFAMGKKKADGSKNYGGFDKNGLNIIASVKTVALGNVYALSGKNVIKWNKVNGADGYVIMRKADGAAKWTTLKNIKGQNVVRYDDSSIKAGTKYTYTVRAYYTDAGNSKVYGDYNATGKSVIAK